MNTIKSNHNIYVCEHCSIKFDDLIIYYDHRQSHNKYKDNISYQILQYFVNNKLEPEQIMFDDIFDDGDVLYYMILYLDNEQIAIDILKLLNDNNTKRIYEFDDEEELKNYLLSEKIINNYDDDLEKIFINFNYYTWEKFCNLTNKSLLMYCIKKKWSDFCIRLLDKPKLARINKKNITDAYSMALKYDLDKVSNKIKKII